VFSDETSQKKEKNKQNRKAIILYNHDIRENKAKGVLITPLPSACPELTVTYGEEGTESLQ
jgi:hypothetical protein